MESEVKTNIFDGVRVAITNIFGKREYGANFRKIYKHVAMISSLRHVIL